MLHFQRSNLIDATRANHEVLHLTCFAWSIAIIVCGTVSFTSAVRGLGRSKRLGFVRRPRSDQAGSRRSLASSAVRVVVARGGQSTAWLRLLPATDAHDGRFSSVVQGSLLDKGDLVDGPALVARRGRACGGMPSIGFGR